MSLNGIAQESGDKPQRVEQHRLLELTLSSDTTYTDPIRDVELMMEIITPNKEKRIHYGYYDGDSQWKIKFRPYIPGIWTYKLKFSDGSKELSGRFRCMRSSVPGRITKDEFNPFWMAKQGVSKTLFRSFHVGDRFFATNWDDPGDEDDGNRRTLFLDWLRENGYNMLSIGSLFTNRNAEGRGKGWDTPSLWPIDPAQYEKLEIILDTLNARGIVVFPFAGFFGASGEWPVDWEEQQQYIKYLLARIGHYPNLIFNISGPEPFQSEWAFKNAMRLVDIKRLGIFVDSLDAHDHILTVHNEKRATRYGDPFIDQSWMDMSTLQGPTTTNPDLLFSGLAMNHRPAKLSYAQETLWAGNKYHPDYTLDQLRKNTYTILFSGSILNFADNNGNSSSGFTGSMDLSEISQEKHNTIHQVMDWFETIPFHRMRVRQDIVSHGFCLAEEGVEYYVYLNSRGEIPFYADFPYSLRTEWINAQNTTDIREGSAVIRGRNVFESPSDGDDWILHVYAPRPGKVATGHFPDIASDTAGNIHLVYNRDGLRYKKYDVNNKKWSPELDTGCQCERVERSDPDIVIDSKGRPHVFCGKDYAWFDGQKWHKTTFDAIRDTELTIDKDDVVYLVHRGGNNGGKMGIKTRSITSDKWNDLTDPDQHNNGTKSNHVYPDLYAGPDNTLHLVQRHGPVEITYRKSFDGGHTWPIEEGISNERAEGPHIIAAKNGFIYITTGRGELFEKHPGGKWMSKGYKVHAGARMQPELGIDENDNVYITAFGGRYNTKYKSIWIGEKKIDPLSKDKKIGFVETAGHQNFAYIVWEEGMGNADEGLTEGSDIVVGKLYPDGRIIGLKGDSEE